VSVFKAMGTTYAAVPNATPNGQTCKTETKLTKRKIDQEQFTTPNIRAHYAGMDGQ